MDPLFLLKVPNVLFCNPSKILSIFPKYSVPARIAATPYTLLCMPFHGHPLRLLRSPLEAVSISPNPTGETPYTAAMQGSPSAICLSPASLVASGSFQTESWQAAQGPATLGLTLEVLRILSLLCCLRCCQQAKAAILQVVPIMAQTMLMLAYASSSWHWALSTTIHLPHLYSPVPALEHLPQLCHYGPKQQSILSQAAKQYRGHVESNEPG